MNIVKIGIPIILAIFLFVPPLCYGGECAYMMVSPNAFSLGPGNVVDVTITVLDKEKKPIEKHAITVKNPHSGLIGVEPMQAMTDKDGKAMFKVKGLGDIEWSPLNVNFMCHEHEVSVITGG